MAMLTVVVESHPAKHVRDVRSERLAQLLDVDQRHVALAPLGGAYVGSMQSSAKANSSCNGPRALLNPPERCPNLTSC